MQQPDSPLSGPHVQQQPGMQARSTMIIECPKAMVGRVIGKNGETIKALQTYTGSLIQVNQMEDPCQITISGAPLSLNLALSMVADIVKGAFKGFALLRQLAGPTGVGQQRQPPPTHQQQQQLPSTARPMYAPGYGLIPTSQLFGNEEESMLPAEMGMSGNPAAHGLMNAGIPSMSVNMQGLQQMGQQQQQQRLYGSSAAAMMNQQLPQFPQAYGGTPGGMPFTGMPYYQPQEVSGMNQQVLDSLVFQGGSKKFYGGSDGGASTGNANPQQQSQQQWAYLSGLPVDSGTSQQQQGTQYLSQMSDNRVPLGHVSAPPVAYRSEDRGSTVQRRFTVGEGAFSASGAGAGNCNAAKLMQAAAGGGMGAGAGAGWLTENKTSGSSNLMSDLADPGASNNMTAGMPGGGGGSPLVMMGQDGKLYYINHD